MVTGTSLEARESSYRQSARTFDYFMAGLAAVFFLVSSLTLGSQSSLPRALDLVAVVLFALALIAGIRKLEAYITILGTDYSIAMTQSGRSGLSVHESAVILKDLGETVEKLSHRAALIHRARNWCVALGIISMMVSLVLQVALRG